ncbi:hypothetical protein KCU81_g597, partial [Aureobasidium melanogenum]
MLLCGGREAVRTRVNTPLRDQEAHDSCSGNLHARYLDRSGREWYSKTASNKLLCFKHFDRINKVSPYGSIGEFITMPIKPQPPKLLGRPYSLWLQDRGKCGDIK